MNLITNEEILRQYIPNVLATVKGETSLYDKLQPFLLSAEEWVTKNFIPSELISAIGEDNFVNYESSREGSCDSQRLAGEVGPDGAHKTSVENHLIRQLIVTEAFANAVPSLDLVLTPNGFGIVSNANIAPASKERVERLIAELRGTRDRVLHLLLPKLPLVEGWLGTDQAAYFGATLFPFLDIPVFLGYTDNLWERYQQLREQLIVLEQELSESCFSEAMMGILRESAMLNSYLSGAHRTLANRIRALEANILKAQLSNATHILPRFERSKADLVQFIRSNDSLREIWEKTPTAELYAPPVFENKKKSAGYFF